MFSRLQQARNGALIAGTNKGIFLLDRNASQWRPSNTIVAEKVSGQDCEEGQARRRRWRAKPVTSLRSRCPRERYRDHPQALAGSHLHRTVFSTDQGKTWTGGPVHGQEGFRCGARSVEIRWWPPLAPTFYVSHDNGATWQQARLASYITSIHGVTLTPEATDPGCFPRRRFPEFRFRRDLGACRERPAGQGHQFDYV